MTQAISPETFLNKLIPIIVPKQMSKESAEGAARSATSALIDNIEKQNSVITAYTNLIHEPQGELETSESKLEQSVVRCEELEQYTEELYGS